MPLVSTITDVVSAHPHLAYAAVFLLALSEAIPVVGAVVPGSALVIGISALVPSGTVALWPLLLAATAGAISGDGLSFWLGRRYHRAILGRWPLNRHPELVVRSEAFLHRHGGKSVFLARFTPGVRAFIPLLAGIARMPGRWFYAANILSALVWAPSHVLPGVLVGASFAHAAGAAAGRLAVLLIAVAVVLWAVTRLPTWMRPATLMLAASGVAGYIWLLADGYAHRLTWVVDFSNVGYPGYRLLRPLLPDYRGAAFWPAHLAWIACFTLLALAGWRAARPAPVAAGGRTTRTAHPREDRPMNRATTRTVAAVAAAVAAATLTLAGCNDDGKDARGGSGSNSNSSSK
jgi:membrane protein DedA with SNARE-associated domain